MRTKLSIGLALGAAFAASAHAQNPDYDVKLLVDSSTWGFSSIDPLIGINDRGAVAFAAQDAMGSAVWMFDRGVLVQVAPYIGGRQYLGAAINDEPVPMIASRDRDPGAPAIFRIRKWSGDGNFNANILVGNSTADFDSASSWVDVNDTGLVAFPGLINGSSQTALFAGPVKPPNQVAVFSGNQPLRPELSDTDRMVIQEPQGSITVWPYLPGTPEFVAGASNGFASTGRFPGISRDGVAVAFFGDRGQGEGLFVSVLTPGGRQLVACAGNGMPDGFTDFDDMQRAGAATFGALATGMTVSTVFTATMNGVQGVYQVEVSATYQNGQLTAHAFPARRVVQAGDVVDGRSLAAFFLYHPINAQGVVAAYADFVGGGSGILRAVGDRDHDGLLDLWETQGIDSDNDGTVDYDLAVLGADPDHADVFVEVDAMTSHVPLPNVLARVEAAFAASTQQNPDGTSGVRLHAILDEQNIPDSTWSNVDPNGWPTAFDALKPFRFGTVAERGDPKQIAAKRMAFRYCIFADSFGAGGKTGVSETPGNDFFVAEGSLPNNTADEQAGTFMHELGHSLGLLHGGGDGLTYKPNYFSVMNYSWQWPEPWSAGQWTLDYSATALPTVDEAQLSEPAGLGGPAGYNAMVGPQPGQWLPVSGPVDLDGDGFTMNLSLQRDLNFIDPLDGPTPGDQLHGFDDWSNLVFDFKDTADYADGLHGSAANLGEIDQAIAALLANLQPAPAVYCSAKVNSLGCTPQIGFSGTASLSGPDDFFVTAGNVRNNKKGILAWSDAANDQPFFGGTLCVAAPMLRIPVMSSGGNAGVDDCSGAYATHFDHAYMNAQGLVAGNSVFAQFWSRDSSAADPTGVGLTGGVCFVIAP